MRVALACPYSFSVAGGVQSHVAGLARALTARGHEVRIVAPADRPVSLPGFLTAGRSVPIVDNGSLVRVALSPGAAAATARLVRTGCFDVVHLHEPMIPAVCLTGLLAVPGPLVGTFHMYSSRPRWYRPFSPLARWAIPRLDARIAVSGAALRHVSRTCPGDYRVIPNGIDVAAFACSGAGRGSGRILFIGRPEPRKGLPLLLEAFKRLPGEPSLDLVGLAPAALARTGVELPARIAARIRARGRVSDRRARAPPRARRRPLRPSLEGESFGIVLVEGMAAGLPVVASAIPGYVDVLPETCGRLVRPGDAGALAVALAELLADGRLREALGAAGRAEARRYDRSRVCEEILAVYEEAVERAAARSSRPSSGSVERATSPGSVGTRKLKNR